MTETFRLADQIRRAFEGNAWHGDSLLELLAGVNARTAAAKPIKDAHSIWELLLHIAAWDDAVRRRTGGTAVTMTDEENFPAVKDVSEAAWRQVVESTKQTHNELIKAVAAFPDSRLQEQVPGKTQNYYNFYYMFSGIVQHELYHAGQIALLKKFQ
ncbi:MAG TPA: DinB family protein [Terriglobales bacterium]|nr:DinB family protein [Terriglobales bacterium]